MQAGTRSWRATSTATAALDLAVANDYRDGTVSVLLGNGDGTFQPSVTERGGVGPDAIVAGDFNGDGRTDLAVANTDDNTVSVLLGNGDGTFQPQVTYAVGSGPTRSWRATSTATAAPTWPSQTMTTTGTVSVLLGNGDGTFQPQVTYAVGSIPVAIVAGDFTGDGRTDLAVAGNSNAAPTPCRCCWATATAPSSPRSPTRWGTLQSRSWRATSTATAALDLAVANVRTTTPCRCCWATATARSSPRSPTRWGTCPTAIVAGDFNGDGRTDLAVAN